MKRSEWIQHRIATVTPEMYENIPDLDRSSTPNVLGTGPGRTRHMAVISANLFELWV